MPKILLTPQPILRLQIKHGVAIGPGKAALLEAIAATGSLNAASALLGMSYRGAWGLVESMNSHFAQPLVLKSKGGATRGGACLSPAGSAVLELYRQMEQRALDAIAADVAQLESLLKADPAIPATIPRTTGSAPQRKSTSRRQRSIATGRAKP